MVKRYEWKMVSVARMDDADREGWEYVDGPAWEAGGFVCLMRREVVPGRVHLPDRDDEPRETGTEVQRTEHAPACHDCGEPLSMDVADTYMLGGVLLVQRQMCCYSCGWDYGTALFGNPPDSALVEVTP